MNRRVQRYLLSASIDNIRKHGLETRIPCYDALVVKMWAGCSQASYLVV